MQKTNSLKLHIQAVIVDDDPHCIEALNILLGSLPIEVDILAEARTLDEAVMVIGSRKPELVFLDVELGDRLGFELFEHFPNPDFEVIFTTAYDKYALQAIKVSALDFLLKPLDPEELEKAIRKKSQKDQDLEQKIETLRLNFQKEQLQRIALPTLKGFEFIPTQQILYCLAEDNYTRFCLKNEKEVLVSRTLKSVVEFLDGHPFFRINRSTLINLNYLVSYQKGKTPTVSLDNGLEFNLSPSRKDLFLQRISQL